MVEAVAAKQSNSDMPRMRRGASRSVARLSGVRRAADRDDEQARAREEVRTEDLEPYVTLRYIARLFKVLAVLMVIMLIGEVVTGVITERRRRRS